MLPHSQILRSIRIVLWAACLAGLSVGQRTFEVVENSGVNAVVGQVHQSGGVDYGFNDSCSSVFSIDHESVVRSIGNLDRELVVHQLMTDHPNCIVRYTNTTTNALDFVVIDIYILDVNDETPSFFNLNQPHRVNITENIAVPTQILRLEPVDNDKGANGTVVFNITAGDADSYFVISQAENDNSTHGTRFLFLKEELDFEAGPTSFNLSITLMDQGTPVPRSSMQTLLITVLDTNDALPMFDITTFEFEIYENHTVGPQHPIGVVSISNSHELTAHYSICLNCQGSDSEAFDHFAVATDGTIYLIRKLDFEQGMREIEFHVRAANPNLDSTDQARVLVTVLNTNDEPPYFECSHTQSADNSLSCPEAGANADGLVLHIQENSEAILPTNLPVFKITDEDSDNAFKAINGVTAVFQPMINGSADFMTIPFTQLHFSNVHIDQILDREATPNITLFLTATNSAPPFLSGTAVIHILVDDVNDNAPVFNTHSLPSQIRISESTPEGREILTVTATDSDAGENATVVYSIHDVNPTLARDWFDIHPQTGAITTRGGLDYALLDEDTVVLTVSATDNGPQPLHSSIAITVSLSPSVSFTRNSFQEYAGYTPLNGDHTFLYLELRTQQRNFLLLYQHGRFALTIEEGVVYYREFEAGMQVTEMSSGQEVSNDQWYSVLLQRSVERVEMTVQLVEDSDATNRLLESTLSECRLGEDDGGSSPSSLYLGGVDIFLVEPLVTTTDGFMGSVRNLLIDDTLIDLGCPTREENIIQGIYSNPGGCDELTCPTGHTTGCVPFAPEPYCSCQGGFPSQVCSTENSYAPIRFDGNAKADLTLDYSFFYDLELNSEIPSPTAPGAEDNNGPPGGSVQRRKRQDRDNEGTTDIIQVVDMSFRVLEPASGTLLYSKTSTSASVLKIIYDTMDPEGSNQATVSYEVYNSDYTSYEINFNFQVELQLQQLYVATLTITSTGVTLGISNGGEVTELNSPWNEGPFKFAEPPSTDISIGGASDSMIPSSPFTGCISRVAVNNIELPLSGLLMAEDGGGFTTDSQGTVAPFCELCDVVTCTVNESVCTSDLFGEYECVCPSGKTLMNNSCVPIDTIGLQPGDEVSLPIYYIVAIAAGGLVLVGIFIFVLICLVRYKKNKRKKSRMYRITNPEVGSNSTRSPTKPNPYTNVLPRPEPALSTLARCGSTATRNSSVSTSYQENDGGHEGTESENTPSHFTRRKSTTSAESGIKTDTDREDRSTGGMQSGNERDSEILSSASESEGFTTSGMETALSPSGVILAGGSSECIMGVPMIPSLTSKERKAITPLRLTENANLSLSEYDTDIETDLSYDTHTPTPTPRHEAAAKDNPRRNSDSDNSTKVSESNWYKSSTASDNERERERAMRNAASYYSPQRSYPPNHGQPRSPEYRQPPKFQEQKRPSPSHHNHSPRPYVNMVASPLTNNAHKYEVLYPNSPKRHDPPRMLFHPHTTSSSPHKSTTPDIPHTHSMRYSQQRTPTHYSAHRQTSLSPSRPVYYNVVPGDLPSPVKYPRSFSNEQQPNPQLRGPTEQKFQDLKSVATINPIAYWEMQDRMKSEVDQVDPYQILSESYVQFEDVSTDPSVIESQTTIDMPSHHHHHHHHQHQHQQEFACQGGREGAAVIDPLEISMCSQLQDEENDSGGRITHFPSADCSEEYVTHTESSMGTLVGSSSDGSMPKPHSNGYVIPSQESFDV